MCVEIDEEFPFIQEIMYSENEIVIIILKILLFCFSGKWMLYMRLPEKER